MIEYQFIPTPYGDCLLAEKVSGERGKTVRKIIFLEFLGDNGSVRVTERLAIKYEDEELLDISGYPDRHRFVFEELLDRNKTKWDDLEIKGTAFQIKVWRTLFDVRPGEIISYSELARRAGYEKAVRAVASAVASNPVSIIIPCHRIVRNEVFSFPEGKKVKDYGNYRWGRDIKRRLIEWERREA